DDAAVAAAVTTPPADTRAWFRGQCLARWPEAVVTANWDSLVFDLGTDPLRRVPMMDPLRGTAAHTAALLDASATPAQLLERLSA
ncbi:MAG: proteasome accessory factor PafA2 family protein, partial [Acidimicrobiales bacterium]